MTVVLCTPEFAFVTGRAIGMDGGRMLPGFPRLDLTLDA
jgi:hypothetical protein